MDTQISACLPALRACEAYPGRLALSFCTLNSVDSTTTSAQVVVGMALALDPSSLASLVRLLAHQGALARWERRFVPVIAEEASVETCSPYRFAQVKLAARQQLRTAYGAWMRERVARSAPPAKLPPPRVLARRG
jgi:hypothetical protein